MAIAHYARSAGALVGGGFLAAMLLAPAGVEAQEAHGCWDVPPPPADSAAVQQALAHRVAHAVRITGRAPVVDGRLDDPAWCAAPEITRSIVSSPNPGAVQALPTVTRVLFDGDAVYFAVRLWDPTDSIVAPYLRRDNESTSDWVFVELDTRHDRRSGFSFGLNPRGVQVDGLWSDDVNYDAAWNSVWAGASARDAKGWTAEYRIPFSQLALAAAAPGDPLVWGMNVYRYIPHTGESANWSPRLPSVAGVVSRFNDLEGIVAPPGRGRFEALPYVAMTGTRAPGTRDADANIGAELRYRPSPSAAVALSVHPDFGQVEADPSVVNLTTFETFLPEQRPLFLESAQMFQFGVPLSYQSRGTSFAQESPFYSRRIGRTSASSCPLGAACSPLEPASVLGALRVSARTANGWSGGFMDAWSGTATQRGTASGGVPFTQQVDPLTHFAAMRVVHEQANGKSALGIIGTWTGRPGIDDSATGTFARNALALGADGRLRFGGDAWDLTGSVLGSRVAGSDAMTRALRLERGYARPDAAGERPDSLPPATAVTGLAAQATLNRTSGSLSSGLATRVVTRGFDLNDVGFQRNSDWMLATAHWTWQKFRPGQRIQRWSLGSNQIGAGWTLGGVRRSTVANLTGALGFRNFWGTSLSWDREFSATDPDILRGGPALAMPARDRLTLTAHTDNTRRRWIVSLNASAEREGETGSQRWEVSPDFTTFISDRLQLGLAPLASVAREGWSYVSTAADSAGIPHYVLGQLHQTTASLTVRGTYAFSARLTLQLYSQAFLSDGWYDDFKEVTAARAAKPAQRVTAVGATPAFPMTDPDFSDRALHLNLLLRWEFLPGSTLFLVWTHARSADAPTRFSLGDDTRALMRGPAVNALQAKVSYWIGGLGRGR